MKKDEVTRYVLGFLFDPDMEDVVLIEKQKPAWQKGRLNGVGGKVEAGESNHNAMVREFEEETGMKIPVWDVFAYMCGPGWDAAVYVAKAPRDDIWSLHRKRVEVEEVLVRRVEMVLTGRFQTISNVPWLVGMAVNALNDESFDAATIFYK